MSEYQRIIKELAAQNIKLIAVSKTKPAEMIQALYDLGQRDFGENRVQEMVDKHLVLPSDIRWHQIGHLQKNKVKYIAPFVHMIHAVDSEDLLATIQQKAAQHGRMIHILLQLKIAQEATKYGLSSTEAEDLVDKLSDTIRYSHVRLSGFMGMASFVEDEKQIAEEFKSLYNFKKRMIAKYPGRSSEFKELSMGMSGDYPIAIAHGATMVRIGSLLFGSR